MTPVEAVKHHALVHRNNFHGPKDYLDAAKNPDATAEQLHDLAQTRWSFVDLAIASHETATPETLRHLLAKADFNAYSGSELLLAIASNPSAPADVLILVSEHVPELLHKRDRQNAFAAGVALSLRQDTPLDALAELLTHDQVTTEFRKVVARETNRPDVLTILAADQSERVRNAARRNTNS